MRRRSRWLIVKHLPVCARECACITHPSVDIARIAALWKNDRDAAAAISDTRPNRPGCAKSDAKTVDAAEEERLKSEALSERRGTTGFLLHELVGERSLE